MRACTRRAGPRCQRAAATRGSPPSPERFRWRRHPLSAQLDSVDGVIPVVRGGGSGWARGVVGRGERLGAGSLWVGGVAGRGDSLGGGGRWAGGVVGGVWPSKRTVPPRARRARHDAVADAGRDRGPPRKVAPSAPDALGGTQQHPAPDLFSLALAMLAVLIERADACLLLPPAGRPAPIRCHRLSEVNATPNASGGTVQRHAVNPCGKSKKTTRLSNNCNAEPPTTGKHRAPKQASLKTNHNPPTTAARHGRPALTFGHCHCHHCRRRRPPSRRRAVSRGAVPQGAQPAPTLPPRECQKTAVCAAVCVANSNLRARPSRGGGGGRWGSQTESATWEAGRAVNQHPQPMTAAEPTEALRQPPPSAST